MAAKSAIVAVQNFYASLNAAAFPNSVKPGLYLDEAPYVDADALTVVPPFVVMSDNVETPEWSAGQMKCIFRGGFNLEVFYEDLGEADDCLEAILYNGQDPTMRAGLAFCTLSLELPLFSMDYNCIPMLAKRQYSGFVTPAGERVHKVVQRIDTVIYQDPQYGS